MAKETTISKATRDYLANNGVALTSETNGDTRIYTLSFTSPCGQDVNIDVYADRVYGLSTYAADRELSNAIDKAYGDYDPSQEAYYWLGNDGHGKNGAPDTMGEVYEDFVDVERKLGKLANGIRDIIIKITGAF